MLPAANRMRRSSDFASVVRSGARGRGTAVIVHYRPDLGGRAPRVGLIVAKNVGGSVVRHRVARRLRAELARRLTRLPAGSATVVRALPAAAELDSGALGRALDRALDQALGRAVGRGLDSAPSGDQADERGRPQPAGDR